MAKKTKKEKNRQANAANSKTTEWNSDIAPPEQPFNSEDYTQPTGSTPEILKDSSIPGATLSPTQDDPTPQPIPIPDKPKRLDRLGDFKGVETLLLEELMNRHWNDGFGRKCSHCNSKEGRLAEWMCFDCAQYEPSCGHCFVANHQGQHFLHWAMHANSAFGHMRKHDISEVLPEFSIKLGHHGNPCPKARMPVKFTITHSNGIHRTRALFCQCREQTTDSSHANEGILRQLMQAGLFPATAKAPVSAFTLAMMKEFHLLQMEGKLNAHDYMSTITRRTDGMFPGDMGDTIERFTDAMRIWRVLRGKIISGQAHGIDKVLIHRPVDNVILWCPACPEPGFNDLGIVVTRPEMRHLNQLQVTLDGNHHMNLTSKNTNPNDISLMGASAYFPLDSEYNYYLEKSPNPQTKSTCDYLKVVNNQNRKKFKNLRVTGVVNCQCSHVLVLSSVDLPFGEQFPNADYALLMVLRRLIDLLKRGDHKGLEALYAMLSYDIMCAYDIHLLDRFKTMQKSGVITKEELAVMLPFLERAGKIVPECHVMGHADRCVYCWGYSYTPCAGHFHGETAEYYWAEANLIGPQTTQMNNGYRQEVINTHHSDWNFKKMRGLAEQLAKDIDEAYSLYITKLDDYVAVSKMYCNETAGWRKRWPQSKPTAAGESRYRMSSTALPSAKEVLENLLAKSAEARGAHEAQKFTDDEGKFIHLGICIEHDQRALTARTARETNGEGMPEKKSVHAERKRLREQLTDFRRLQKQILPMTLDALPQMVGEPEDEDLFLPSAWPKKERSRLGISPALLDLEYDLRQGAINVAYLDLRRISSAYSVVPQRKKKQLKGTKAKTRAQKHLQAMSHSLDKALKDYNANRRIQEVLAPGRSNWWKSLGREDTWRKNVAGTRQVGDSKVTEAAIFSTTHQGGHSGIGTTSNTHQRAEIGTQMQFREGKKPGPSPGKKRKTDTKTKDKSTQNGCIWSEMPGLPKDDAKWMDDSNRVQFFRDEAEMERWREQWEMKIVEMLRTLYSFERYEQVWSTLSKGTYQRAEQGFRSKALKTAAFYKELAQRTESLLRSRLAKTDAMDIYNAVRLHGKASTVEALFWEKRKKVVEEAERRYNTM